MQGDVQDHILGFRGVGFIVLGFGLSRLLRLSGCRVLSPYGHTDFRVWAYVADPG